MTRRNGTRKVKLYWLLAVVLALVAAACGDSTSEEGGTPASTPPTEQTAAPDADPATTDPPDEGSTTEPEPATTVPAPTEEPTDGDPMVVLTDDFSVQHAEWATQIVDTSEFKKDPPYRVATVVQGPTNGWGTIFDTVMNYTLEQSGLVEDQFYVPWDFTTESQSNGIEDAIAQDVDIILLTALSRAGLSAPVERAVAAGIPVVTCMATVAGDGPTVDVSQNRSEEHTSELQSH